MAALICLPVARARDARPHSCWHSHVGIKSNCCHILLSHGPRFTVVLCASCPADEHARGGALCLRTRRQTSQSSLAACDGRAPRIRVTHAKCCCFGGIPSPPPLGPTGRPTCSTASSPRVCTRGHDCAAAGGETFYRLRCRLCICMYTGKPCMRAVLCVWLKWNETARERIINTRDKSRCGRTPRFLTSRIAI